MLPEEPIPTQFGSMDVYLIEARSIGGLSGSPVFVVHYTSPSKGQIYLLGLIHGHWDVAAGSFIDATEPKHGKREYMNVGIAMVTPAQKLIETMQGAELVKVMELIDTTLIAREARLK